MITTKEKFQKLIRHIMPIYIQKKSFVKGLNEFGGYSTNEPQHSAETETSLCLNFPEK